MSDIDSFNQVYEHIKSKVKSTSVSLLIIASLLTNWDLLYFLATSSYSSRETIQIAVDVYFSPWHLAWVYLFLSALMPIVLVVSKGIYNMVNQPLERFFNEYVKGITYPTKNEYEDIIRKYEALEESFKRGELYDGLTSEIYELEGVNRQLSQENKSLNELIDSLKSESNSLPPRDSKNVFVDSFFFGSETEEIASELYKIIKNHIKSDNFDIDALIPHYSSDLIFDESKIKSILDRWSEKGLLEFINNAGSFIRDEYHLTDYGTSVLFDKEAVET